MRQLPHSQPSSIAYGPPQHSGVANTTRAAVRRLRLSAPTRSAMASSKPVAGKHLSQIFIRNMKWLQDHISSDLEKQMLVVHYVEELEGNRSGKKSTPQNARTRTTSCPTTGMTTTPAPASISRIVLRFRAGVRSTAGGQNNCCWNYSATSTRVWPLANKKVDSVQMPTQCMEFAFDVACISEKDSDRPVPNKKKDTLESLRQLYLMNGRRFQDLTQLEGRLRRLVFRWILYGQRRAH